MPIHHAIWQVGEKPAPLQASQLAAEEQLREMIIGREVHTYASCRLDLLAQSGLISRVWARDSERLCS